ncbi:MAG TPA: hypothetical protein VKU62_02870 [Thermoanaerobaculia bacterium]|nr:hypothetical protein [Thermoanaerobaculia bacterium]
MRKSLMLAACAAAFLLIAAPIYMNQDAHLLTINGHVIGEAVKVNGVWAVPVADLQKNIDGTFAVLGNRLQIAAPRDVATGMATGKRQHKPFVIVQQVDSSTPIILNGGKQFVSVNDLVKLSGGTFVPPANLPQGAALSLNFTKVSWAKINWGD